MQQAQVKQQQVEVKERVDQLEAEVASQHSFPSDMPIEQQMATPQAVVLEDPGHLAHNRPDHGTFAQAEVQRHCAPSPPVTSSSNSSTGVPSGGVNTEADPWFNDKAGDPWAVASRSPGQQKAVTPSRPIGVGPSMRAPQPDRVKEHSPKRQQEELPVKAPPTALPHKAPPPKHDNIDMQANGTSEPPPRRSPPACIDSTATSGTTEMPSVATKAPPSALSDGAACVASIQRQKQELSIGTSGLPIKAPPPSVSQRAVQSGLPVKARPPEVPVHVKVPPPELPASVRPPQLACKAPPGGVRSF